MREKISSPPFEKTSLFGSPLWQRGDRGDFFGGVRRELFGELWFQGTSQFAVKERGGNNV
jgi:hypothetical protein